MPVLFTSANKYSASKTLFDKSISETAGDDVDELFYSKNSCTSHDHRIGEYCFCEAIKVNLAESAIKVDLAESEAKCQKNLSSTVSLLCILFEDLGCAIKLHVKFADEVTELHSLDPRNYLFNGQEKGDDCYNFLFGRRIINEASSDDREYLQLYEFWCLFAYREFYKNLVAILDELSLRTFGEKASIPNRFCKHFGLHNDERIQVCLMKLSNNTNADPGFSYETVMNNQIYTIHSGIT
jgi:hypothetical protein